MRGLYISITLNVILLLTGSFLLSKRVYYSRFRKPNPYTYNSLYYRKRVQIFSGLPPDTGAVYMIGNSITELCPYDDVFKGFNIKNRGIQSDVTEGVLHRLHELQRAKPKKIFLEIGTNDLGFGISERTALDNYTKILDSIHLLSPCSTVYCESLLPRNDNASAMAIVPSFNQSLKNIASSKGCIYIDLYTPFVDGKGGLKKELTMDGLHPNGKGYELFAEVLKKPLAE